jgi:hypothetical protein
LTRGMTGLIKERTDSTGLSHDGLFLFGPTTGDTVMGSAAISTYSQSTKWVFLVMRGRGRPRGASEIFRLETENTGACVHTHK